MFYIKIRRCGMIGNETTIKKRRIKTEVLNN